LANEFLARKRKQFAREVVRAVAAWRRFKRTAHAVTSSRVEQQFGKRSANSVHVRNWINGIERKRRFARAHARRSVEPLVQVAMPRVWHEKGWHMIRPRLGN
jgi:hypothetical protein